MSRPLKPRCIRFHPNAVYFKPQGVPLRYLAEVALSLDEVEAIRLCDHKNLEQKKAAQKIKVSQSTLQRILTKARKKIAEAIITGKALKIKTQ